MSEHIYQSHGEPLVNERGEIYLARAGEIVRCRDCKYADISYTHAAVTGELHCYGYLVESWDWYNDEPSDGVKVEPDGFCKWGIREAVGKI